MIYTDEQYAIQTIKKRDADAHKGDFGKILIFAGSLGMAGAAVLCGRAALRTGSGLVQFLLPELPCEIYPILQTAVPEATCVSFSAAPDLTQYDAIAAGPGIGQSPTSLHILAEILNFCAKDPSACAKTLVLDADALNLISTHPELAAAVQNSKAAVILTPHPGEAKRLLGKGDSIRSLSARQKAVGMLAQKYHCIAILKGAGTLITEKPETDTPDAELFENTTGNPGMATGGSGDALTGMIVSLAGQRYRPIDAARLGVFLHGKAGDLAAQLLGEMSMTAGDIVSAIPDALKLYYENNH